jgi:starch-binding outer membrane protein, SusD/RagB family
MRMRHPVLLLGLLAASACNFDQSTNPNSPDPIGENPSRNEISVAANGMLIAFRNDFADLPVDMGIVGREVLRLDPSDPRFTTELLHGPLDPGGDAFGGDHWADQYVAIREANLLLAVLPTASDLTPAEQSATSGYAKTIKALNYSLILVTHTQDSIPIVTDTSVTAPPAPFATNAAAYDHVITLLEEAKTELLAGGAAFPFALPPGFTGFNTPATFVQFNRGLRARVAVYRNDFAGALAALAESFIDPVGPLDRGVYMDYGTGAGDFANPLSLDPQAGENFAHPSLLTGAQLQVDGTTPDQRFVSKIVTRAPTTLDDLTSNLGWNRYPSPSTPIPIIKNEELILLRAEALLGQSDFANALLDINLVRQSSGGLAPYAGVVDQPSLLAELLYNKRYSLMYEGAHSWIDYRRYGLTASLQSFDRVGPPPDVIFPTLPIPTAETQPRS